MRLTLLFASLFLSADLWAQWLVSAPTVPDTLCTLHIEPVDENVAWALAIKFDVSNGTYEFAGLDKGYFFKTTNGGQSWSSGLVPIPGLPYFSDISALDASNAWACGIDYNTFFSYAFKTIDGGQSWTPELTDAFVQATSFIDFIHFFDSQHGIAMGDPAASDTEPTPFFEIYLTDDGGQNWERVSSQHIPAAQSEEYGIGGLYYAKDGTIWFGTDHGRVYRSENMGADWEVFQTQLPGMGAISFADPLYGIASYYDGTTQYINLTTDGGETWTDINAINPLPGLSSITMVPGSRYIVAVTNEGFLTGPYRTLLSKDLGATWLEIGSGENASWAEFISPQVGYAGEFQPADHLMRLYSYNGDPLSGVLSGKTLEAEVSTFPNPAADFLNINVKTAQPADFLLLLNDANGKLVKQEKIAKTALLNTTFALHYLPAGVYSLTITTTGGSVVKKVVKY